MEEGRVVEIKFTQYSPFEERGVVTYPAKDMTYSVGKMYNKRTFKIIGINPIIELGIKYYSVEIASVNKDSNGNLMKKEWARVPASIVRVKYDFDSIINTEIDD